jgi:N-acetyl-gamma-glutamyl-phosphate reductase
MPMKKIKIGIAGASGYTGGELIRLLLHHPSVQFNGIISRNNAGKKLQEVHTDLIGETDLSFTDKLKDDSDVLFLCFGHNESRAFLEKTAINEKTKIIDISQDFRLNNKNTVGNRTFVYGLPELNKKEIITAKNIANPGCFATAIQLALLPFAQKKLLSEVHCTAITGSTGAGQSFQATTQFSWRSNNVSAYKVLQHQHLNEIHQSINSLQKNSNAHVNFVPWRGPFARGIFVTLYFKLNKDLAEVYKLFNSYYANQPFTLVSNKPIDLKQVVNTNKCLLYIEKIDDTVVVHSVIDNLLKGASGQAVQNMNLMCGFDETKGLQLKSIVF